MIVCNKDNESYLNAKPKREVKGFVFYKKC